MFAYCENDPVNKSDPTGEIHVLVGALIGGVVGGGLELARQLVCGTKISDVNWGSVAIETLSGTAKRGGNVGRNTWQGYYEHN